MRKLLAPLIVLGLLAVLIVAAGRLSPEALFRFPTPVPAPSPEPIPTPRKPWLPWREFDAKVGGPISPDGQEEIHCDLPGRLHMHNSGGNDRTPRNPSGLPGRGLGLCVFTSIEHSALHQNVPVLIGFQKWMEHRPGGGHPEKVDRMITAFCKERGIPVPKYIQVEGNDLEVLRLACKTGRMPGVTYCWSPTGRYGGQRIAHMVSLVHASDGWFCVLDNNHPGEDRYEWMSEAEFRKTYTGWGGGWAVILLNPSPPPAPTN